MTQKVKKSNSLKRQRELSPGDNEKQSDGLKKRKSEKLEELFGDATFPVLKIDQTDRKTLSTCSSIQQSDDGVSSTSGIGFLDALGMVTSGSGKQSKNKKSNKLLDEKNQLLFKGGNEKQQTLHKTDKKENRTDENKNKVNKEQHKAKNLSDKKDKIRKTAEGQSEHKKKYVDLKKETKMAKNKEHEHHKERNDGKYKMAKSKPQKYHKSDKEEDIKIEEKQHHKKDQEITGIEKYKKGKINKQRGKEGKEETSSQKDATVEEITSSSGIGFAEALAMTTVNKSKTKKKRKDNQK